MQKKRQENLFSFCFFSIGVLANRSNKEKNFLKTLGEDIGLLFQLTDDFLDIKGQKKNCRKTD